jgi:hypothetical protein
MKIDAVDFYCLSMPEVTTEADGSQDALLMRVQAGRHVGWVSVSAPRDGVAFLRDLFRPLPYLIGEPSFRHVSGRSGPHTFGP